MKEIAIYGAGGFGREVACLINRINEVEPAWNLVGFFDEDVIVEFGSNKNCRIPMKKSAIAQIEKAEN